MKAILLLKERHQISIVSFVEIKVWQVPSPVSGSAHDYKYSLAYVVKGECVVRYDNESGKGDHRHVGNKEEKFTFTTAEALLAAFWEDVDRWRKT